MSRVRQPDAAYEGKNGFRDAVPGPVDEAHPDDLTLRHVRLAQYVLANKGSFVPTPEKLRELGRNRPQPKESLESIEDKIAQLKQQYAGDLDRLFAFQRAEYLQELDDHRLCHDDSVYMDIDEEYPDQVAFRTALEELDAGVVRMDRMRRDMDHAVSMVRYNYVKMLVQYVQRRNVLRDAARHRREVFFPQTVQQYQQIPERDVQLRVARLLTGTRTEQEKMMDEYGWAYRTVQPLLSVYRTNGSFRGEVDGAVGGLQVSDPGVPAFTRFSPVS